jgi:putative flavoprotein involved in K+ transport
VNPDIRQVVDVVVIGGGQSGLAAGYYLRRADISFVILDSSSAPGGAWPQVWQSLRLFSSARQSSLPGWPMPPYSEQGYPDAGHVVDYLTQYERRYQLPVHRPVRVTAVHRSGDALAVDTDAGTWLARSVISATGTWSRPYVPAYPGRELFEGLQLHTVGYRTREQFAGQHVAVVGGGNSAAQILADLTEPGGAARVLWLTRGEPRFLPDDVDGAALFDIASRRFHAVARGEADPGGVGGLGDIVMTPAVQRARERGVLKSQPMFERLTAAGIAWSDATRTELDAIVWCTGFRHSLEHLGPLRLRNRNGHVPTEGTRACGEPRLHLLGYGDWTGPASATLLGVGRTARSAVADIASALGSEDARAC